MRYRPFARTGMAVSALSLALEGDDAERTASDWRDLVHGAFEEGVNAFELVRPSPALLAGFAEGAAAVKRTLLFVALRIDADADFSVLPDHVDDVIAQAGLGELNLVTAEASEVVAGAAIPPALLSAMRRLKDLGRTHRLGIAGQSEEVADAIQSGAFDAVVTHFNLLSGWRERNLIRTALERQMGVVGCEPCPPEVAGLIEEAKAETKPGWFKRAEPLAGAGSYKFLASTPGWSAEQLCLGYALTEPSLATVQARVIDREHLASLAEVADRDLPAAISAQIEMARFSAESASGGERRSRRRSA